MGFEQWPSGRPRSGSGLRRRLSGRERLAGSLSMLAATLESTGDGILVVDREGRVVGRNTTFLRMWGLTEQEVDDCQARSLLPLVLPQVADPEVFRSRLEDVYAQPESTVDDEVELLDGRVFSRHSQPQLIDGRVVGRVWSFRDRTAERRLERDLRRMAYRDELTGLPNRALFMARGRALAEAAEATGQNLGVAVLDLDDLKVVNDRLGHRTGDEVLQLTAARLRAAARVDDVVARLGGDEFGVLMPDAGPATVAAVLQRMADAMSGSLVVCGRHVLATISGGSSVAGGSPGPGSVSLEALLHEADLAMYRAKADGRGRVRAYDAQVSRDDPRAATSEVADIVVDPDGLVMVLQPICRLSTGLLVGHEALARFPGRGHREVGEWFALARAGTSAPELEARAVRAARAQHDPAAGTYLTVNVSPSVLGSGAVQDALAGDLHGVVVEVTEDSQLDLTELDRLLGRLRLRGARVAMDDTGAGYDGLRRLVRLRPEIVKLDRELVHEVHAHPEKRAMVEALVSFCRQTGASMCAEGIETLEELRTLAELGVDLGQGWLIGRPAAGAPPVNEQAARACGAVALEGSGDLDRLRMHLDLATTRFDVLRAAQRAVATLQADDLTMALLDGEDLLEVEELGWTSVEHRYVVADYPATGDALLRGVPFTVRTDDPTADPAECRNLRELGFRSMLLVPLMADDRPIGIVEVFSRSHRTWNDREVRVCQALADEVADAVVRVTQQEHRAG